MPIGLHDERKLNQNEMKQSTKAWPFIGTDETEMKWFTMAWPSTGMDENEMK